MKCKKRTRQLSCPTSRRKIQWTFMVVLMLKCERVCGVKRSICLVVVVKGTFQVFTKLKVEMFYLNRLNS